MEGCNIPNMEGMSHDELMRFYGKYKHATKATSVKLVGDRKDAVRVVQILTNFAINKACAITLRLEGKIDRAMTYEHAAELAYERLPSECRW